jgi:hypothetical protein
MEGASSIQDFRNRYGVKPTFVYDRIRDGSLVGLKAGRRTLIPRESAERWLASLPPLHPKVKP